MTIGWTDSDPEFMIPKHCKNEEENHTNLNQI